MKATVNGIDTCYELHGKPGAPWLAFSHSLACSLRMWDGQVAALGSRFRILLYDTRGHGGSAAPKGPYTLEGLADDLRALVSHLDIQRMHFVGLSLGGMIGQTFVLKYPGIINRLVLADTGHAQTPEGIAQWQERIRTAETQGMQPLVESTLARWFTEPFRKSQPERVTEIAELIRKTPVAGYVSCCQAISKLATTARLKDIRVPVLAIAGDQDAAAPGTRFIGETVPGAKLVMLAQAAHIANVEQPEAFNRALEDFLTKS